MDHADVERLVQTLADTLADATEYTNVLLRKQGIEAAKSKSK